MAIVDKKTPRLGLLLPNADNFLQDDVERLIQSFDLLDVLVVMRDQTTGKIADDQLSEVIARLDAQGKIATSALPSSVVQKGADGKIDASVLPSIAIIDSFPVPNEASMLGLQCERGDIAIRTDLGRSFILTDLPPSKLSNWRELTSTNVTSVNGQVGAVTGLAKAGVNDDITQLTALSGPLRLGGDAVGDYDAVTMRQLRSVSGGAGGPSMNGVMNYGVGDFHLRDSRAYIQPYEVTSDGQLLNRADWPELWAYAQMLTPISDADWLADPAKRGKYSLGNGTTTFRVPDRNGVQAGSIYGLFARGDGGTSSNNGEIFLSAAPNITGGFVTLVNDYNYGVIGAASGAMQMGAMDKRRPNVSTDSGPNSAAASVALNASASSPVYGRNATTEVYPNHVVGVWVIRASGGFVAANTSWSVINGDATRPADGTTVDGGNVYSFYTVNGVNEAEARFRARANIGGKYYARISVTNSTTQRSVAMDFDETGSLTIPNNIVVNSANSDFGGVCWANSADKVRWRMGINDAAGNFKLHSYDASGAYRDTVMEISGSGISGMVSHRDITVRPTATASVLSFVLSNGKDSVPAGNLRTMWDTVNINSNLIYKYFEKGDGTGFTINWPSSGGVLALQGTSGRDFKKDIADADVTEAVARIEQMRMVHYVYKDDVQERVRFGIIAEEAEAIAPQYIKHREETYDVEVDPETNAIIGGKTRDRPSVDVNPIVMDLMGCAQYAIAECKRLSAEVEELKAAVAAINVLSDRVKQLESAQK